jgi:hypothetical protein
MAAGGERKALRNGSGDFNKDYQETVQKGLFFFCIQIYDNYGYIGMDNPELNPRKNCAGSGIW